VLLAKKHTGDTAQGSAEIHIGSGHIEASAATVTEV